MAADPNAGRTSVGGQLLSSYQSNPVGDPNAGRMSVGGQALSSYAANQMPMQGDAIGGGPVHIDTGTPGSGGVNTDAQGHAIAQGQQGAWTPTATTTSSTSSPVLNANVTIPSSTQTNAPPAVITSDKAQQNLSSIGTNINQAQSDAQAQALKKQQDQQALSDKQVQQTKDEQNKTPSLDDQLSSLIASLNTESEANLNGANSTQSTLLSQQAQNAADQAQQWQNTQNAFQSMRNGTYPLTGAEQSVLDATQQQFVQTIQLQQQANTAYTGQMKEMMASLGIDTSAPTQAMGNIQATINSGNSKIGALNTDMTLALSNAQVAFQKQNFDELQASWADAAQQFDSRQSTLQSMLSTVASQAQLAQTEINTRTTTALSALTLSNTATYQEKSLAIQQAQLDEKTRDDMQKNLIAEFTAGMIGGSGGSTSGITPVAVGANGKVDAASQQAVYGQYVQAYGPTVAGMIKGLTDYSVNPADWKAGATKGMSRATAVGLAKALDPTYDDSQYSIRAAYKKSLTSNTGGSIGAAVNAANKSINHLTAYTDSMAKIPNGWIDPINAVDNAVTLNQGVKQSISSAKTEGMGVADELAKFFKGTGTTDVESINGWRDQLSTSASPAGVHGLVQGAVTLLAGQLETFGEQYQRTMGQPPPDNLLGASAMANLSKLKNGGYTVNVPGVLYTDKDAYVKSDPNATANMIAAVTALTSAGLPVTPENILQAAQSM